MRGGLAASALAALLLAAPAKAQRRGSVEAGALARATLFDPSLGKTSAVGFGGRASWSFASGWLLEADFSSASVDGLGGYQHATYGPVHVRVAYAEPYSDRGTMLLGVGYVRTHFGGDFGRSDNGLTGLLGIRVALGGALCLRLDGTMDAVAKPANGAGSNWNAGLQLGIGYLFGRR